MNANKRKFFFAFVSYKAAPYKMAEKRPAVFFRSSGMDAAVAPSAHGRAVGAAEKEDCRTLVVERNTIPDSPFQNPVSTYPLKVRQAAPEVRDIRVYLRSFAD